MFRFGSTQKVSGKLDEMLEKPNLTVEELFSIENIIGDIKHKVQAFVEYCRRHRDFTIRIITLAMDTSMEQLEQKGLKDVAYIATEFLNCDEDGLAELFFDEQPESKVKNEAGNRNESDIPEKIESDPDNTGENKQAPQGTIQIVPDTAQQTTQQAPEKQTQSAAKTEQKSESLFEKYELVKLALNILKNPSKNETCLGYIYKLFSFLIRKDSEQPLQFFSTHAQYTKLLIGNLKHDSIANLLAQIVACEDKNRIYKYEEYKKQLFGGVIQCLFEKANDEQFFEGIMIFVEEVLNNTKQSYYEYFEDFKRCANVLVSEKVLKSLYELMLKKEGKSFKNAVTYLHMIAKRINSENEDMDYYDKDSEKKEPTMNFQTDFLYANINTIVRLIGQLENQNGVAKNLYLSLVVELMKNQKFSQFQFNFVDNFALSMKYLKQLKHGGIIKNSLFQVIDLSITRADPDSIVSLATDNSKILEENFAHITQSRQNKLINKDENICYDNKILILLKRREQELMNKKLEELGIKIGIAQKKYGTSLGVSSVDKFVSGGQFGPSSHHQKSETRQAETTVNPLGHSETETKGFSVGKNHIMIPSLNLPASSGGNLGNLSSSSGSDFEKSNKEDGPKCFQDKRPPDIIVDTDVQGTIIEEHEEVERLVINSPKRDFIGFMGTSSPRAIDFSGSGGFRSDRSNSQDGNSARSRGEDSARKGSNEVESLRSPKGDSQASKQPAQQKTVPTVKQISKEEVTYFVRHAILI